MCALLINFVLYYPLYILTTSDQLNIFRHLIDDSIFFSLTPTTGDVEDEAPTTSTASSATTESSATPGNKYSFTVCAITDKNNEYYLVQSLNSNIIIFKIISKIIIKHSILIQLYSYNYLISDGA